MFILVPRIDSVKINPASLHAPVLECVRDEIEATYVNRVIAGVGLVIALWKVHMQDLDREAHAPVIQANDGGVYVRSQFTLLVFRPQVGASITGRVKSQSHAGLRISLGFFDDVYIPAHAVREGMSFIGEKGGWTWHYAGDNGDSAELDIVKSDSIRFTVRSVVFNDLPVASAAAAAPHVATAAAPVAAVASAGAAGDGEGGEEEEEEDDGTRMMVTGHAGDGAALYDYAAEHAAALAGDAAATATGHMRAHAHAMETGTPLLFPPLAAVTGSPFAVPTPYVPKVVASALTRSAGEAKPSAAGAEAADDAAAREWGAHTCAMAVMASITEDGTGCTEWWDPPPAEEAVPMV